MIGPDRGNDKQIYDVERLIRAVKSNGTWTAQRLRRNDIEVSTLDGHEIVRMQMTTSEFTRFTERVDPVKPSERLTPSARDGRWDLEEHVREVIRDFLNASKHRSFSREQLVALDEDLVELWNAHLSNEGERAKQFARKKSRTIIVHGGRTGHRYLLAHRHTKIAERLTRVCFDMDDECVVHFHQHECPPEEEILAAKLILEHREPWLRNEATMLGATGKPLRSVFKNPFGGLSDGVADAVFTQQIGGFILGHTLTKNLLVG